MLDTEFRGGTAITLKFTDGETGDPTTLERPEVERRINAIAEEAGEQSPLFQLKNADIVAIDPEADGITSDRFQIKTVVGKDSDQERQALLASVVESFQDVIDSRPALQFLGSGTPTIGSAPVFKILDDRLGSVIGKPEIRNDVSEFVGGVAILMEDIRPRVSEQAILDRLDYIRNQPDFASNALKRTWRLIVIEGTEDAVESAVVVAKDPAVSVFDEDEWRTELASSEWQMVRDGLTQPTTLALVQQFSAEIAQSFRAQAIVAVILSFLLILIYIWVRFGSVRYSLAAITALVHDVTIAIGLIALAEILYANVPFLVAIGLQPYKIDLALVAAILTIVGYSLNDTIVILDRIRENRGKLAYASRDVVNLAISQTISRTVITSGTTLVALIVLFVLGGDALSSFTYALICGVLVGTYSSIAVAAPLVFTSKIPASATRYASVGQRGVSPEPDESLLPPDDRGPGQLPPV
jgi:SecD/SecF fusion protein